VADPLAHEDGLTGVGVGGPFIEGEDAQEVAQVVDLAEERVGQVIVNRLAVGMAGKRSRNASRVDRGLMRGQTDFHVVLAPEKAWSSSTTVAGGAAICRYSMRRAEIHSLTRIRRCWGFSAELGDIEIAVAGFEQVGLRAPRMCRRKRVARTGMGGCANLGEAAAGPAPARRPALI